MARTISVGGITTAKPGVYQNSVQRSQGSTPSRIDPGIVAILAESTGTIAPTAPTIYRKGASANAIKQLSGDLRDAVMAAFSPSKEDPSLVRGAREVYAIRVNTATQSTSSLAQSTPTNVLTLTSRGYGLQENGISRTMAAGTNGAFGSKLTISRYGYADEVGDNLGFLSAFAIRYYGAGSACAMTVSNTALTTTVTAGPGSENLNLVFSTYDTLAKLAEAVNGFRNGAGNQVYEMVIMAANPTTFACTDLDKSSSVAILTETDGGAGVGLSTTALTDFDSGSITGLDAADLIRVSQTGQNDEWLYTTSTGPNVLKRGYNNTTAQVWAGATAVTFRGVTSTWKAVQDWINTYSQHITATRASYAAEGLPATSAKTYFSSGSEGSATSTQWQAALDELRKYRVNHIVLLTSDSSFHTLFDTHMTWRWGEGNMEALGYVAAAANETLAQIKTRAKQLNSQNVALHFEGLTRPNYQGVSTAFAPWMMAVVEAGMRAGMAFGEGTEYKRIFATAISYNTTSINLLDDGNTLSEAGICYADYWDGAYRFVRCLSTWTNNDDAEKIQFDVRNSLAFILYKTRIRVREQRLGRGQRTGSASSLKSTLKTALEELRDIDGAILDGSQRIGDDIVPVPGYEIFPIETNGNVTGYGYGCTPAGADLFFVGDTFVQDFSDVA